MSDRKLSVSLLDEDKVLAERAAGTLKPGAGEAGRFPRKAEQRSGDCVDVNSGRQAGTDSGQKVSICRGLGLEGELHVWKWALWGKHVGRGQLPAMRWGGE